MTFSASELPCFLRKKVVYICIFLGLGGHSSWFNSLSSKWFFSQPTYCNILIYHHLLLCGPPSYSLGSLPWDCWSTRTSRRGWLGASQQAMTKWDMWLSRTMDPGPVSLIRAWWPSPGLSATAATQQSEIQTTISRLLVIDQNQQKARHFLTMWNILI